MKLASGFAVEVFHIITASSKPRWDIVFCTMKIGSNRFEFSNQELQTTNHKLRTRNYELRTKNYKL
jgi:hypothetical protein